jgi:hypothetical protein
VVEFAAAAAVGFVVLTVVASSSKTEALLVASLWIGMRHWPAAIVAEVAGVAAGFVSGGACGLATAGGTFAAG